MASERDRPGILKKGATAFGITDRRLNSGNAAINLVRHL